jgi:hypothetical protein
MMMMMTYDNDDDNDEDNCLDGDDDYKDWTNEDNVDIGCEVHIIKILNQPFSFARNI